MSYIQEYYNKIIKHLESILTTEEENIKECAKLLADQIAQDKLINIVSPGGHSNLATQEIFFRAGGLVHINPILDGGTLLTNGALRSMEIERLPGYGKIVFNDNNIKENSVLIICNAYGINSAVIDIALEAKKNNVTVIGITSIGHAKSTAKNHPARHQTKENLCDIADIVLDCKVRVGDAVIQVADMKQKIAAMSTFANSFVLNSLIIETVVELKKRGIEPPVWRSGNAEGGDEWNQNFISDFKNRIKWL